MTEPEQTDPAKAAACLQDSIGVGFAAMDLLSCGAELAGVEAAGWVNQLINEHGKAAFAPLWVIWSRTIAVALKDRPVEALWPWLDGTPPCRVARNTVKYAQSISQDDTEATIAAADSMSDMVDAAIRLDQLHPKQAAIRPAVDLISNLLAVTAGEMLPPEFRSLRPEDDPREPFPADGLRDAPDGAVMGLCQLGHHGWWERQGDTWQPLPTKAMLDHQLEDCPYEQV